MQIIKSFIKLFIFICPVAAGAQSTYLPQGDKAYQLIDRLEIKQQTNTHISFSTLKPFSRKWAVAEMELLDSIGSLPGDSTGGKRLHLTSIDKYNLQRFYMNNTEWVSGSIPPIVSKKTVFGSFYHSPANLVEVNNKDFFLVINPVLQIQYGRQSAGYGDVFLNSRGITARGIIAKKLGFVTTITDNQEIGPQFFKDYVAASIAVPGQGFYKTYKKNGVDYFDARGYLSFNVIKYIDLQFGYDKNFIGNGYRSLFLSDWGNSNLFLKLNTKIWKLNYQNLFMELMPQFSKNNGDVLLDRKYAAMHHLSANLGRWLNIGLFEGVIFGRKNHFDFQYFNPIIFLRHVEGTIGSPDNALLGGDFKANIAHKLQVYGQLMIDEFVFNRLTDNKGWWANKYGTQLGVKYIDALKVANLDLQFELNRVRPYTYSHNDSVSNYTHYNQPLAHPLGANFAEFIAIVKYQPLPKLYVLAKIIYYKKGLDSTGYNAGGNIFRLDTDRYGIEEGYKIGGGKKATCLNGLLELAYEVKENLFFDLSYQNRSYKIDGAAAQNTAFLSAGIRWNIARREYDF